MKEWLTKLKEWWSNLAQREKQMVAIGGTLLGLFLFYQLIWSPCLNYIDGLRNKIKTGQTLLVWMQGADKEIARVQSQSKGEKKAVSPVVLLSSLQREIAKSALDQQLTQMKQAANDTIALQFQKVAFDKLVTLLTDIAKAEPVSIAQMSVIGDKTPGIVNAEIMLKLEGV